MKKIALLISSLCFLISALTSCLPDRDKMTINGAMPDSCIVLRLTDHRASTFLLIVEKNTLNDTAKINSIPILPGYTGTLFRGGDFFGDSISLCYQGQRVSGGELVLSYDY
jgi:hypothetical protein